MAVTVGRKPMTMVKNAFAMGQSMRVEDQLKNKAAEVFAAGEIVQKDTTVEIIAFAAGNLVNTGASDDRIDVSDLIASIAARPLGIAMKAAPASGQIFIPVALFQRGAVLEANLHEGANGASPTAHVAIAADLHKPVGIAKGDDGIWYFTVDAGESCGVVVAIPGIANNASSGGGLGDSNIRVHVELFNGLGYLDGVAI